MKRYTTAMKRKLVAEYATGEFSRKEFLAKHQIPNSTFHQWVHAYAEELLPALDAGITVSAFSKAHNPYDNSVCEAFFKSIKAEELYRRHYRSMREFRNSVAAYIAEYNAKRPHAANNYLTPDDKERSWSGANTDEAVRSRPENKQP